MEKNEYWLSFNKLLKDKKIIFFVILVTVMCFGLAVTSFSIGIDDPAREHYLYSMGEGNMIQQGRLLHVALNKLTNTVALIPFFNDFVGACLFGLSAVLFCALFQLVSDNRLSSLELISFAAVYISYPIINEKFIYNLDVVVTMSSYCSGAMALAYSYLFIKKKRPSLFAAAVVLLILSISSYESFIFLYFCGVFTIFIVKILINDENLKLKEIFLEGLKYALILLCAVFIYYSLVVIVQKASHQFGIFTRPSIMYSFKTKGIIQTFADISRSIAFPFLNYDSLALKEMLYCCILGLPIALILSIKKKNPGLFLCYLAFLGGNFLIHYICGLMQYRTSQTFCLFIGFSVMLAMRFLSKPAVLKKLAVAALVFLVYMQAADMNRWFYNDSIRYKKEQFVIDSVATELVKGYDLSKPIVFTSHGDIPYLVTDLYPYADVNGASTINWSLKAFNEADTPSMFMLFGMNGYDFLKRPSIEQAEKGMEYSENMEAWPSDGYVKEFEDIIVVNMS